MENQELIKQVTEKAENGLPAYDPKLRQKWNACWKIQINRMIDSFTRPGIGTGGLRGIMGAGTNRMNIYTVGAATQGSVQLSEQMFCRKEGYFRCCGARLPQQ